MNRQRTKTQKRKLVQLTVSVFEGLLLFGGLGDDFDPLAEEDANVCAVAVEHLDGQHEVLSLVGVGYVQGFGCAIILSWRRRRNCEELDYFSSKCKAN